MRTPKEVQEQKQKDVQFIVSAVTAELYDLARYEYFETWENNGGMGWFFSECVEITNEIMFKEGSEYLKWLDHWIKSEDNSWLCFSEISGECFDWYHMYEARKLFKSRYTKDEDTKVEISEHIGYIINSFESDEERLKLVNMAISFANEQRNHKAEAIKMINDINELKRNTTSNFEVDIRIECARRSAKSAYDTISKYTEKVDKGEAFVMSVSDHDSIQQNTSDIAIALDMNDNMCISDNWYNLKSKSEAMEKSEEAPTSQCINTHTFDKVKEVIQILQTLDNGNCVDGETMEYILTQVGMSEQMYRQLVMGSDINKTLELVSEKFELK